MLNLQNPIDIAEQKGKQLPPASIDDEWMTVGDRMEEE
jgi:hypothetical protein